MIHLNIIPNSLKNEIRLSNVNTRLKKIYEILFILSCLYAILLLSMYLVINFYFIKTVNETTRLTASSGNKASEVKEINNLLNYMDNIQKDSVVWSRLLNFLKLSTATDITYSRITISKKENLIALNGISETRESLLSLKTALENAEFLDEIDFPRKNLLEKTNINFEIKATLKNYDF